MGVGLTLKICGRVDESPVELSEQVGCHHDLEAFDPHPVELRYVMSRPAISCPAAIAYGKDDGYQVLDLRGY